MSSIQYLDGTYEAYLQIFDINSKEKKPCFIYGKKAREEYFKRTIRKGLVQIGKLDTYDNIIYKLKFISEFGETVEFELNELLYGYGKVAQFTRGYKCTYIKHKRISCIWNGQNAIVRMTMDIPSKSFPKRLRKLEFYINMIENYEGDIRYD